jgi:predicted nuclease of predicted toxin-antitoxin system
MKLLLDECLPEDLTDLISGHEVSTTGEMGWKGIKNGELMRRASESGFEAFLTVDKNLPHQQNTAKYPLAIIVFDVFRNTLPDLKKRIPKLYEVLPDAKKGNVYLC